MPPGNGGTTTAGEFPGTWLEKEAAIEWWIWKRSARERKKEKKGKKGTKSGGRKTFERN